MNCPVCSMTDVRAFGWDRLEGGEIRIEWFRHQSGRYCERELKPKKMKSTSWIGGEKW